ncbi:hypothetical protein Nepgr_028378 [Nepenthes gracilis]|uniref:Uncharacterized protein n=1 Tax=Nepenthes gracilis TaxID=150966 RepID=A0AAD3Y3W2_NEPGR|nr:hypothetical protein Nepgr_028378 [Nepenthes gracilis]
MGAEVIQLVFCLREDAMVLAFHSPSGGYPLVAGIGMAAVEPPLPPLERSNRGFFSGLKVKRWNSDVLRERS